MSRFSPPLDTSAYNDGGSMLAQYLDYQRSKQYYDFAREEAEARRQEAERAREFEMALMGLEPGFTYSPDAYPGSRRTYEDPVLAGPSLQGSSKLQMPEDSLAGAIGTQMQEAQAGKPLALAGELLPGGGGFASRTVYREVPEEYGRYDEVYDGLYQDRNYLPEQIQLYQDAFDMDPAMAEIVAQNPAMLNSMPRDILYPDQWKENLRRGAYEDAYAWENRRRELDYTHGQEMELEKLRQRRPSSSSSPSLTQDREWQISNDVLQDPRVKNDPSKVTDQVAQDHGYRNRAEWNRARTTGRRSGPQLGVQSTVDEIVNKAFGAFGSTPEDRAPRTPGAQPPVGTFPSDTIAARLHTGGSRRR